MIVARSLREEHAARNSLRLPRELLQDVENLRGEILHRHDFATVKKARCNLAHDLALF